VLRDVIDGKVSLSSARDDYGVVLRAGKDGGAATIDVPATDQLREERRVGRQTAPAIIDRGEGFEKMLRGEFKPWIRSV
ncbi:MAG: hypothetical protein WCA56_09375, partial [Xanthobacteraceae bacterium]